MISLGRLISPTPIPVVNKVRFHQATVQQILDMGEPTYWGMIKVWDLKRSEMIPEENEETKPLTDFQLWVLMVQNVPDFRKKVIASVHCFLRTKIEFLPISNTIMIGESDSLTFLDEAFYYSMQEICQSISHLGTEEKEEQFQETENMSETEKRLIAKMKANAEKIDRIKNGEKDVENRLVKQVISLVAIGKHTFEEVCNMTIIQMINLLKKHVEIQQYELYTSLSPYMDSKNGQGVKHWLDT